MPQFQYVYWPPPLGQLGNPLEPWVLSVGVDPANLGAHRGKELLLVAEPFDGSTGVELGLYGPIGEMLYPEGGSWGWIGGRSTLYVAATTGRSTANDDTPAATYVPGKLAPFNFGASLFAGVDPLNRSRPGAGLITLADPDHGLNHLIGRVWDNAPLTLKRGDRSALYSIFETVGRFRSAGLLYDVDVKQFRLRDLGWQLSGPLHGEFYQGTGGLEGDATLKGKIKPWALGHLFNIEPVFLSASAQIFQFSLSSAVAVSEVRHGGVPLNIDADYPNYAALAAATIPSGECATCLAESLVRPNVTLQFSIRLDVTGDADTTDGHSAPLTRASIARRIATTRGLNRIDDATEVDTTSINHMEAYHSAPVGWYFPDAISKAEALDRVLAGVLGWWRVRPDGRFCLGWLEDPALLTPAVSIAYKAEGMSKPRMVDTAPPRAGTLISFQTNYGPEPRAQLAGSVSDADAAIYGQNAQYGQSLSPAVASLYPTSVNVVIDESGFRDEADAALEAARQQTILGVERRRWELELEVDPFLDLLGVGVAITGAAADLAMPDVATLICVGIDTPGTTSTTFEFFG